MTGRLFGVGLGPGDPELVTVKAARLIGAADVVAFHAARHGRSVARAVAAPYLREGQVEELLVYPVTTETTDHPGGYQGAIDEFYESAAARLAAHLDAGRDVVVLAEGDPFFYGSYMHMHKRLAHRYPTEVVPGVTSVSGAAAAVGRPLVERDEVLTVLPGTLGADELTEWLATTDAAAVLKLGRAFPDVREAFDRAGVLDRAIYVERASTDRQRTMPLADVDPASVPYFSLALLPSPLTDPTAVPYRPAADARHVGEVVVVGLGPGARSWTTPEAADALASADVLVGYGPYLDRVPANPRQERFPSDNRVEAERAAHALELAHSGRRVAVVSSGDPGVFAMAAAVLEVAERPEFAGVPVRIVPGLTAAQAVAAKAGAPLGHDFCVISLSDNLRPWSIVERRISAAAEADLVTVIYNPASSRRPWQIERARDLLLAHRAPETPVILARNVGRDGERVRTVALSALVAADVDMRTLVIVGSSQTRLIARPDGEPRVYTPRHYPERSS